MNDTQKEFLKLQKELENIIRSTQRTLRKKVPGRLRIQHNKGSVQYYMVTEKNDTHGKYLRKSNQDFIKSLAQKEYAQKVQKIAKKKLKCLMKFLKEYDKQNLNDVYDELVPARRELVEPYLLSEEEYAIRWQSETYPAFIHPKENQAETLPEEGIYTEKNEKVRSKSEKILADKFFIMNIPYHYEKPVQLRGFGTVHPDFTVLNKRTRKEYYWEHLGMMGDPEYCDKAIRKIHAYEKNGIFPGEQLILTYETGSVILDSRQIEQIIRHYLI